MPEPAPPTPPAGVPFAASTAGSASLASGPAEASAFQSGGCSMAPLVIALLSGGLDSATAAALALESGHRVIGLSFDYGQRHRRELQAASTVARHLGLQEHRVLQVDLAAWGGSSLTDTSQELPVAGLQPDAIPSTYVPCRNTVFIALALSLAEATGAEQLVLGVNAVDYSGYPDCRPDYLEAFQRLADLASRAGREGRGVKLWAPLVEWDKPRIVREALRLGVPLASTWSCYAGGEQPCGVCDSCRIRDAALIAVGRGDLAGLHRDGPEPPVAVAPAAAGRAADVCGDPLQAPAGLQPPVPQAAAFGGRPQAPPAGVQAAAGLEFAAPEADTDRAGVVDADHQPQAPPAEPARALPVAQAAADLPEACENAEPTEAGSPL